MIRRGVFIGLSSILIIFLSYLVIQSRRKEAADRETRLNESIKTSKPTLTRVFNSADLQIVDSKMTMIPGTLPDKKTTAANHALSIRNKGKIPFQTVALEITYFNASGKDIGRREHRISEVTAPGDRTAEFQIHDVPARARAAAVKILYCEF